MGAAEPPLVHRRNPTAASAKLSPLSSIFIWSGQLLVPLLPFLTYLYILRLYDRSAEVGSAPSCGPQAWLRKVSAVPSIGEWGGGGLCEVKRRESCVLALCRALWRSPRCASAGMNLYSARNNDTSNAVTKRGKGRREVRWRAGGEREVTSKESRRKRERERERDGVELSNE